MASTSDAGTVLAAGLLGILLGFAFRSWLVMLTLDLVDVNASWGESLLATLLISMAFASAEVDR